MVEADGLNREAALLSNSLADFAADDVAGRRNVVDQLLDVRRRWKRLRVAIDTGVMPQDEAPRPKPTEIRLGMSEAEVRMELQRSRVNVSKYQQKLGERPDHKKAVEWQGELDRLRAMVEQYETELIRLNYETA